MTMKKIGLVSALVIVIGMAGAGAYLYWQNTKLQKQVAEFQNDPKVIAQQEVKSTVEMVGKVVALPEGEVPVVATVTDKEKLKAQAFFAKVENGDKVLIYAQAKKIYLYRPSENKLIEAAPLNIGENTSSPAPEASGKPVSTPTPTPTPTPAP